MAEAHGRFVPCRSFSGAPTPLSPHPAGRARHGPKAHPRIPDVQRNRFTRDDDAAAEAGDGGHAAAGVYLKRGLVLPYLVVPVAVAVLAGAFLGTKLMERMRNAHVRQVFAAALAVIGVEMLLRGFGVRF